MGPHVKSPEPGVSVIFDIDFCMRPRTPASRRHPGNPPARERMKAEHPIHIDRARAKDQPGGAWQKLDPISQGRVQILPAGRDPVSQARRSDTWNRSRTRLTARLLLDGLRSFPRRLPSGWRCPEPDPPQAS